MSEKLPSGVAFKEAGRVVEAKHSRISNARANKEREKEYVYGGELTTAELVAESERLKRECRERRPEWFS